MIVRYHLENKNIFGKKIFLIFLVRNSSATQLQPTILHCAEYVDFVAKNMLRSMFCLCMILYAREN